MRDLLTFRLGFGLVMAPPDAYPIQEAASAQQTHGTGAAEAADAARSRTSGCAASATLPLMHQPGERWMYNTGSDVLGVLIARASGQPLETFFRERIFEPLGMKDTGFSVPAAKLDRLATSYWINRRYRGARALRRRRWRPVEPPARLPGRRRGAGLDRRRLPGLRRR